MHRTNSLLLVSIFAFCITSAAQANASSTSGIDTPTGILTLPLSVQGMPGCTLIGGTDASGNPTTPNLSCNGEIGIGTSAPDSALTVSSGAPSPVHIVNVDKSSTTALSLTSQNVGGVYVLFQNNGQTAGYKPPMIGANGNDFVVQVDDTSGTSPTGWTGALTIAPGGNVGIGTSRPQAALDVNGETKVGNSGTACSASNAGALRWNGVVFQGCNGSAWLPVGSYPQGGTALASNCSGNTLPGGFCDASYYVDIVFPQPYTYVPTVLSWFVSLPASSGCLNGATDLIYSNVSNVTQTGFRLWAAASPVTGDCPPYDSDDYPAIAGWVAF